MILGAFSLSVFHIECVPSNELLNVNYTLLTSDIYVYIFIIYNICYFSQFFVPVNTNFIFLLEFITFLF